jgi:hypothetical protein
MDDDEDHLHYSGSTTLKPIVKQHDDEVTKLDKVFNDK